MRTDLAQITLNLLHLLAESRYDEVVNICDGVRLSATDISHVIAQYGRELIPPTSEAVDCMDIVEVKGKGFPQWSISVPLWTREEGRSDLTLELTIADEDASFRVEIDDLHVL